MAAIVHDIHYSPADPNDTIDGRFNARASHALYLAEVTRQAWASRVVPLPVKQDADGFGMQWGNLGELVLPFASLHEDATDVGYGEAYILEGAWARLNDAVLSLLPGEGRIVGTYGRMYEDVERALHAAPQSVKDSLVLHRVDFDNVQDDPGVLVAGSAEAIADSQAADAAAVQRNFVNVLTLGQLRGSNGRLERMARLSMWFGAITSRLAPGRTLVSTGVRLF